MKRAILCVLFALVATTFARMGLATAEVHGLSEIKCKREGSVQVEIESHIFRVPRAILATVTRPDGQYEPNVRCAKTAVIAGSFYIFVSKNAGSAFYNNWITRLPTEIEVTRKGQLIRYTAQFLESSGAPATRDDHGFDVALTKSTLFYDASPVGLSGHANSKVVFMCSRSLAFPNVGRHCRVSYPYDDVVDITYGFWDGHLPEDTWVAFDGRVREFMKGLLK